MTNLAPLYHEGPNGRLAYLKTAAARDAEPGVIWFGGFRSDMTGSKAETLHDWAQKTGRGFVRFDYSGHGASSGAFEEGTISAWRADALSIVDAIAVGPQIFVGSSMGAWIAALVGMARPERLAGFVGVAPALDFTEALMWADMDDADRTRLETEGRLVEPSPYDDAPTVITKALIDDGRRHLLLDKGVALPCPVRILQGTADRDVPWRHALRFADALPHDDVETILVKGGDHRLSTPADLIRLRRVLEEFFGPA